MLPEEKLLKLIRKDSKQQSGGDAAPVSRIKPVFVFLSRVHAPVLSVRFAVMFLFVLSCVYFLSEVIYPFVGLQKINAAFDPPDNGDPGAPALPDLKPFQYYLDGIANRQVFKVSCAGNPESFVSTLGPESIRDFSLVGIISGDNPQAIIQDNKTQKTYYLNKGQSIAEYTIEEVLSDKVILNAGGQRYEFFL
ncbi:MAG: hypothetical protein PHC33_01430 [Candidatus Omnitrophica bacterium]|nr:hypothetical protein [Candidatus Omnitrophota bacterium]